MAMKKHHPDVTIEDVIIQPDKRQPILVNFQNGYLKEEKISKIKCGLFYDNKSDNTVLGISTPNMVYKGYKPNPKKELLQTMIGVYNKKTETLKLISCERWDVAPILDKEPEIRTDFDENAIAAVNKEFGSKKTKRRTEQYEKLKIDVDIVRDQLENDVANIEVQSEYLTQEVKDDFTQNNHLPPCNREATSVVEVYNIYDIIPKSAMKTLYDLASVVLNEGIPNAKPFFKNLLSVIEKGTNRKKNVSLLLYLQAVCKWLETPIKAAKNLNTVKEKLGITNEVTLHMINNYTIQSHSGRLRPQMLRDKAIVHCMILVLIINNYGIDIEEFAKAINIRIGVKKLKDFARTIGLTYQKEKNIFVLKLPLPAPPPVVMTKRARRK